jgi:protein SCO1/2
MRTLLLLLTVSFAACGAASPASEPVVASPVAEAPSTLGTIKEVRKGGAVLVIAHEEIPGMMPAMTMPFRVDEKARRSDLAAGDRIRFWPVERDGVYTIVRIERA